LYATAHIVPQAALLLITLAAVQMRKYNIVGYESGLREQERKNAEWDKMINEHREQELKARMRENDSPFRSPFDKTLSSFALGDLMQLFAAVCVVPLYTTKKFEEEGVMRGYAAELATEVCDSNTAEQLVYTIQQLMLNEQDQKYAPQLSSAPQVNSKTTSFQDLEAWAVQDSNGTVTVDTDKLKAACDYVKQHSYHLREHQWAQVLLLLYDEYFSQAEAYRVNEVLLCSDAGVTLILCYVDSSRLTQLAELPSLWEFSTLPLLPRDIELRHTPYSVDCAVMVDNGTLIVEAAVASLTVHYSESVRQQLITQLLVLKWFGTAVLNKGILPAISMQVLGHVVVDYRPNAYNGPPALTTKAVPDYQDIPITLHNLYFA
jgi:hypothetical protein